ncbi:CoA-binding protein [Thermoplasma sp. Kam2015]|uniref:CoA-binding protein n=1 Tax=Thermoplasma sp. Kam2015 TaxID=2094122 RepID=UPI000D8B4E12|nr:CoA-binding protein [Thermoplasma sp. Kam2015]PYB68063.1 CoA-binding protein [Thermoplasma sp. Kam2015]
MYDDIEMILKNSRIVAVVGISDKPERDSYRVAKYLSENGYEIIPVNPAIESWNGKKAYRDLTSIPVPVDVVDVFRKPEAVPEIVDQAILKGARVLWLQEGIQHKEAEERARKNGLLVVSDRCMMKEHMKLMGK